MFSLFNTEVSPTSSHSSDRDFGTFLRRRRGARTTAAIATAATPGAIVVPAAAGDAGDSSDYDDMYVNETAAGIESARSPDDVSAVGHPDSPFCAGTETRVNVVFEVKEESTPRTNLPSFAIIDAQAGLGILPPPPRVSQTPLQDIRQRIECIEAHQMSLATSLSTQNSHQVWMEEKSSAVHTDIECIEERLGRLEARFKDAEQGRREMWEMVKDTHTAMMQMWPRVKRRMDYSDWKRAVAEAEAQAKARVQAQAQALAEANAAAQAQAVALAAAPADDSSVIEEPQEENRDTEHRAKRRRINPPMESVNSEPRRTRSRTARQSKKSR